MMLRVPFVRYRKTLIQSVKSSRTLNSTLVGSDGVSFVPCELCVRHTQQCVRAGLPRTAVLLHSRGSNPAPVTSVPSTHGVWPTQGHAAGVHVRYFSTSTARCIDADDEMGKSENGPLSLRLNQRGPHRGFRHGRRGIRGQKQTPYQDLSDESKTDNKWAITEAGVVGSSELAKRNDGVLDEEAEEFFDIHNPQGKLLQSENVNEFDAQYFGEEQLSSMTSYSEPKNVSDGQLQENDSEVDEGLNTFDKQYFGENVFERHVRRSERKDTKYKAKPGSLFNTDLHEIDRQYLGAPQVSAQSKNNQPWKIDQSNGEPQFLDTDHSEENILEELRRKDEMELIAREKVLLAQSEHMKLGEYEPHEKATKIEFKKDSGKHEEVKFVDDKEATGITIPKELQRQLQAERKVREEKHFFNTQPQVPNDIEPEVLATLSLKKKKKPKQPTFQQFHENADPTQESSNKPCSGCGAILQCNSVDKPGFLPKEQFLSFMENVKKEKHALTMKAVCVRCWNLTKQKEALNVNVNQDDYANIIKAIRKKRALVLVMVDLLDFPCSFIPNLKDIIGNKNVCLVGNKIDLLPVDSKSCYNRIQQHLLKACVDSGVCAKENVQDIFLVSAKTGYGIERIITKLHKNWGTQGDVYILGTANVGKSTLFNRLLDSDYCKSKASYLMGKATISRWPGTTLNLLRFPIISLNRTRMAMRIQRLREERVAKEEKRKMLEFPSMRALDEKFEKEFDDEAYVKGDVGRTFDYYKDEKELAFSLGKDPFNLTLGNPTTAAASAVAHNKDESTERLPFKFHPDEFDAGRWFYDTPGVIHDQQILTKLTLEELKAVVPQRVIQPKSLSLKPGHSFFLAGLGRLDYLQGNASITFTVFACRRLPIRVVPMEEADAYYVEHAGHKGLVVPRGGEERMKTFPALESVDMAVTGIGWQESAADILFSSAGWASVTAGHGMEVHLKAYTPGGKGCLMRQPALLPFAVLMRGERVKGTPFYGIIKDKLVKYV